MTQIEIANIEMIIGITICILHYQILKDNKVMVLDWRSKDDKRKNSYNSSSVWQILSIGLGIPLLRIIILSIGIILISDASIKLNCKSINRYWVNGCQVTEQEFQSIINR